MKLTVLLCLKEVLSFDSFMAFESKKQLFVNRQMPESWST